MLPDRSVARYLIVYTRPVLFPLVPRSARTENDRSSVPTAAPTISGLLSPVPRKPDSGSLLITDTNLTAGLGSQLSVTVRVATMVRRSWLGDHRMTDGDTVTVRVGGATSRICKGAESDAVSWLLTISLKATAALAPVKSPGQAFRGTVKLVVRVTSPPTTTALRSSTCVPPFGR